MPDATPARLRVLLVEDDLDLAAGLVDYLATAQIEVDHAVHGREAERRLLDGSYDLWLLDIQLPGEDGLSICRRWKASAATTPPVLFLTARGSLADRLEGFEAGAIDYVVKPFEPAELAARIRALTRHTPVHGSGWIEAAGFRLDASRGMLVREGRSLQLGASASRLLRRLMQASPGCVSRAALAEALWGEAGEDDDLRTHLYTLRRLLRRHFGHAPIHSERGLGVRFGGAP